MGLVLKPNCELCDKDLPVDSVEARICSYECTFCRECVDTILSNVCPKCGGGFSSRPIRPAKAYREGVSREHQLPSDERVHCKYTENEIREFAMPIKDIEPAQR